MTTNSTDSSSGSPASESHSPVPPSSASRIRVMVLVGLLLVMLVALWYDRKVARAAVDDAYARVGRLNAEINSRGGAVYMTNRDVQKELNRQPVETFQQGGYLVEVYAWRAGLPIKSHKYYAVYADGPLDQSFIFLKHYPHSIDLAELEGLPPIDESAVSDPLPQPSMTGGGSEATTHLPSTAEELEQNMKKSAEKEGVPAPGTDAK